MVGMGAQNEEGANCFQPEVLLKMRTHANPLSCMPISQDEAGKHEHALLYTCS
jgi:hypothetical protein